MQATASAAVAGTDQVDEFVTTFYLDTDSVDATEQEDLDFYELYNKTPGISHTPRSVAFEQLADDDNLTLLEDLLSQMLGHHNDSRRRSDSTVNGLFVEENTRMATTEWQEGVTESPMCQFNQEASSSALHVEVKQSS